MDDATIRVDRSSARNAGSTMRRFTLAVCTAGLLALAASPALAASHHHKRHHGHVSRHVVAPHHYPAAYGRYFGRPLNAGGVNSPGPIYRGGYYLGSDPDPNIRFELIRDPWFARCRP
jgi:hypothetical protein